MGALLEIVRKMAAAMAQMQKSLMDETPRATSDHDTVSSLSPPLFAKQLVIQFRVLEDQQDKQFLMPVLQESVVGQFAR